MIIENGYITLHKKVGGGYDTNRNPIAPTITNVVCPCQYQQKGRSNTPENEFGKYVSATYDVYVDIKYLDDVNSSAKFVLTSNTTGTLGTFEITKADVLELVGQIKISA